MHNPWSRLGIGCLVRNTATRTSNISPWLRCAQGCMENDTRGNYIIHAAIMKQNVRRMAMVRRDNERHRSTTISTMEKKLYNHENHGPTQLVNDTLNKESSEPSSWQVASQKWKDGSQNDNTNKLHWIGWNICWWCVSHSLPDHSYYVDTLIYFTNKQSTKIDRHTWGKGPFWAPTQKWNAVPK